MHDFVLFTAKVAKIAKIKKKPAFKVL